MSFFSQSRKSCPKKRKKKKIQPSTALKTTQHMKKRPPSLAPSQGLLVHKCPNPLPADGDKETPLSNSTALLLEVGAHQQRGHWPRPSVESLTGTRKWDPHRPETVSHDCQIHFSLEWPGIGHGTQLRPLGTAGRSQVPTDGPSPAERSSSQEVTFEGHGKWCKKICWRRMILSVSGARNYKNKTGKKSLNGELLPNPGELISYTLSWKATGLQKSKFIFLVAKWL